MTEHCLFCGGPIRSGDESCEVCGIHRVAKAERRVGAPCPRCASVRLSPVSLGNVVVQGCTGCRGLFVSSDAWDELLELTAHASLPEEVAVTRLDAGAGSTESPYRDGTPTALPPPTNVSTTTAVGCPVCKAPCERVEFAGISRIVVDVCARHGLWLDAGELALVVARVRQNPSILEVTRDDAPREPSRALSFLGAHRRRGPP